MAAPSSLKNLLHFVIFLLLLVIQELQCDSEFEGLYHLPVEHSFDQGPALTWTKRGVITIRSISNNLAQFVQSEPLTQNQLDTLQELSSNGGIYRIRVPVNLESPHGGQNYVTAFVKACSLYESSLTDQIVLNADTNGNTLLGVSVTSSQVTCSGAAPISDRVPNWNTSVDIRQTVPAPVPDTVSYIQKMEREKAAKAKDDQSDNRSFLAKYWMYIVPVFILMMVASSADQGGNGR